MSFKKRLRYLEQAWQQRAAQDAAQEHAAQEGAVPERSPRELEPSNRRDLAGHEAPGSRAAQTAMEELFAPERGWQEVGNYTLRRQLHSPNSLAKIRISEHLLPSGYGASDLLFFDTETTGLSGGAGNSIFLIGMAWIEGDGLTVEQVFLKDFPGEGEFLPLLAERFNRYRVFVSYNGRAFDAHVLRTRFLLNRMVFNMEQQTDLLYWSRRLWRRTLPDCSLSTVEREILGIRRELDVSGFEVPGIYLEYLRSGRPGRLEAVLAHNLQDVRTLAELLVTVNSILVTRAESVTPADSTHGADRTALGNYFLSRDERWGVELLQRSFTAGDEAAGRTLSLYYKRAGAWEEAVALWKQMIQKRKSLFAAVELAKYFEHRARDVELALEWVQTILSWRHPLEPGFRSQLHHRRERLLKKLKR
ncbi:MAG: ribonuclease H-like domain-containing protein [Spirochaetaceae bacterium]|nr:MAG: ribonuclease H-like domain-containing protein [Spirochaetaceae bacterium]